MSRCGQTFLQHILGKTNLAPTMNNYGDQSKCVEAQPEPPQAYVSEVRMFGTTVKKSEERIIDPEQSISALRFGEDIKILLIPSAPDLPFSGSQQCQKHPLC